jgi:nucleotide-binding universal stress UspA family protein
VGDAAADSDSIRRRIKQFLRRELPASLPDGVEIRTDWRRGEPGDVIVQFADATHADLIVLSIGPSRWWLPTLPGAVRRVLQRSKREVLIVRPESRPTHAVKTR